MGKPVLRGQTTLVLCVMIGSLQGQNANGAMGLSCSEEIVAPRAQVPGSILCPRMGLSGRGECLPEVCP